MYRSLNKFYLATKREVKAIIEIMRSYGTQTALAGVLAMMGMAVRKLYARVKKEMDEQAKVKAGVLAILHDRLYQSCQHFIRQKYILPGDLRNLSTMHDSYSNLGGNGAITEMVSRVKTLPLYKKEMENGLHELHST